MKSWLNYCIRLYCLALLLQLGFAQEVSFRITPLHPVQELRAEALKVQPPREQGSFREPDLVELVKLDSAIKLDVRYATTNNFLGTPRVHPSACIPSAARGGSTAPRPSRAQG
ncbi:MAG: hypothetical protein WB799_10535 [Candidatus Sulfotelmatobacter sp.]